MDYIETIFWIESGYDRKRGWPDQKSKKEYYQELELLLARVGWRTIQREDGEQYPVAIRKKEYMELRPLCLHGIIEKDSPKGIGKLLSMAKGFHYRQIEVLSSVPDMTGPQYLRKLHSQQTDMAADLLKVFDRLPEGEVIGTETLYKEIEKKYHIQRAGEFGEDVILKGIFRNLLSILAGKERLTEGETGNGTKGYRKLPLNCEHVA